LINDNEKKDLEPHLIISDLGKEDITHETDYSVRDVESMADKVYRNDDLATPSASGSFLTLGMIVAPCTIKTLSGISNSYSDNYEIFSHGLARIITITMLPSTI